MALDPAAQWRDGLNAVRSALARIPATVYSLPYYRARVSGKLSPFLDEVTWSRRRMDRDSAAIEQRFLSLGTLLEKLTSISGSIVTDSDVLVALATGKGISDEIVKRTSRNLSPALDFVRTAGAELTHTTSVLRALDQQMAKLLTAEAELSRALEPLHFLKTLFRLETAALPSDVQTGFSNLMADIDGLRRQVQTIFERNTRQLGETRHRLSTVMAKMEKAAGFYAAASVRKDRITDSLTELQTEIERNSGHELELTTITRGLSREMNRIVVALQMQDIVSQKLAHVNEALDLFFSELQPETGGVEDLRAMLRRLHALTSIQRRQVESTHDSLQESVDACRQAADQINQRMANLSQDCLLLSEFKAMTAAADGMVQLLLESIQDVKSMLAECVEVTSWAKQAITPIAGEAARLSSDICGITEQMRRIALNTHLRAIEMSGGSSLEVLAAHTQLVSSDAMAISADASSRLENVVSGFQQIAAALEDLHQKGAAEMLALSEQSDIERARLHQVRDETLLLLERVAQSMDHLSGQVDELQQEADLAPLTRGISSVSRVLVDLEAEITRLADRFGAGQATHEEHAAFASSYTMESERITHAQAVGEQAQATVSSGDFELF